MKRSHKIWLLVFSVLPILIIPFLLIWIIGGGIQMDNMANPEGATPFFVGGIVFWALLISLISTVVWIYYLVHVIRNQQIDNTERIMWVLLFIFVSFISQMVYFFIRIWNEPSSTSRVAYTEGETRSSKQLS